MRGSDQKRRAEEDQEHYGTMLMHGWVIVCGIVFVFVVYGLFAFFVIGDKQPADWDFGNVEDIPGQSVYSTYPYRGRTEQPRAQHIDEKPPSAVTGLSDNSPPPATRPGRSEPGRKAEE